MKKIVVGLYWGGIVRKGNEKALKEVERKQKACFPDVRNLCILKMIRIPSRDLEEHWISFFPNFWEFSCSADFFT